jgi:multicomponent Na+:H+ antiporter subunit G
VELVIQVVSGVFLLGGAVFNLAAGVGVLRLPDVFTRLHASGMKDTMGSALTLVGLMFLAGFSLVTVKLIIIWALLWLTCSVATHAVARAAFLGGVRPVLAEDLRSAPGGAPHVGGSVAPPGTDSFGEETEEGGL